MQHYQDVLQDRSGNAIAGAIVTVVYNSTSLPAILYSNYAGTQLLTTVITDADGSYSFYVSSGRYNYAFYKNGKLLKTQDDVFIDESTALQDLSTPSGASMVGFNPTGTVSATTVQTAINELDTEKASTAELSSSTGATLVGTIQIGAGAVATTVDAKLKENISVKDFGAVGNGVANDTTALQNFLNAGGGLITDGTYLTDALTVTNPVTVICQPNVIIKKRSTAQLITLQFNSGSQKSIWIGGTFDANTALQTGWTYAGIFNDRQAININTSFITIRNITFKNWLNHPLVAGGDYLVAEDLVFDTCATGPIFGINITPTMARPTNAGGIGQRVKGITLYNCGNLGINGTMQHGFDTYCCLDGSYIDISMKGMDSPTTGASYAISGWTDKLSENCNFSDFIFDTPISETFQHLAFSLLGSKNCTFSNLRAYNFTGLGLEVLSIVSSTFMNVVVDCNYRKTTYSPTGSSNKGLSIDKGQYNPVGNLSREMFGSRQNVFTNCIFKRAAIGGDLKVGRNAFSLCTFSGNKGVGVVINQTTSSGVFIGSGDTPVYDLYFFNCKAEFNNSMGISLTLAQNVFIEGGSYSNNGQDTTLAATSRAGINGNTATRFNINNCQLSDLQTFTNTNGLSFIPGVCDTSTNNLYSLAITLPYYYNEGQNITVKNAGGVGVDVIGKVVNINADMLTLEFPNTTFVSTGNTTALTGTWSGSGTALTGVSTLASTEIVGPLYVTNGTDWRLVIRVDSDTSIVINAPFATPLTATTLTKLTVNAVGIPSQQYGTRVFGTVAKLGIRGNSVSGNVLEKTLISLPQNCEPGSQYWRKATVTANASPLDLLTGQYSGNRILGWTVLNSAAITGGGATSYTLAHTDSAGTVKDTLGTGFSLSLNQQPRGGTNSKQVLTNDKIIATFAGGTPTAGTMVIETFNCAELPELL